MKYHFDSLYQIITGGEVTCNDVSCYIRDDCKPRYVQGVCCPTYDNCPPIGNQLNLFSQELDGLLLP